MRPDRPNVSVAPSPTTHGSAKTGRLELRRVFFLCVLCLVWMVFPVGCGLSPIAAHDSYGVDFTPPNGMNHQDVSGAIVFIVDGLNGRIFQEMLDAGQLPNFQRYFVDRGLYAPRAVANTPSVTLANLTSIATGRYPGHHGAVGVNWFDRRELIHRNYATIEQKNLLDHDHDAPLIYESFAPDEMTISVFYQPHRGATKFYENWLSAGPAFFFGWYLHIDRLTLYRFGEVMDLARGQGKWPTLLCAYLLGPDFIAYEKGVSGKAYRESIRHADYQIGRVLGDLKRAGLLEKIVIAVVSDHSHSDVKHHFDLPGFLEHNGFGQVAPKRLWENTPLAARQAFYEQYDLVVSGSGDRYREISLRGIEAKPDAGGTFAQHRWAKRLPPMTFQDGQFHDSSTKRQSILRKLMRLSAIDAVAWSAGDNSVQLQTRQGMVQFDQPAGRGGVIFCKVLQGGDPLGWKDSLPADLRDGKPAAPRRWLEVTCATTYPNLPAQILAYFRSPRHGDLVVFAAPQWDFHKTHRGGHGGLRGEEDLWTPLLIAGPGVPHTTVPVAQTVDLLPTLLTLLNKPLPANLDGQSLIHP